MLLFVVSHYSIPFFSLPPSFLPSFLALLSPHLFFPFPFPPFLPLPPLMSFYCIDTLYRFPMVNPYSQGKVKSISCTLSRKSSDRSSPNIWNSSSPIHASQVNTSHLSKEMYRSYDISYLLSMIILGRYIGMIITLAV